MDFTRAWEAEGPYIEKSIGIAAKNLVRDLGLPADDIEDIKQELRMDLLSRLNAYDSTRSSLHTFITLLVRNKTENLRESFRAKKRDVWKTGPSLDEDLDLGDGYPGSRLDQLSSDEYDWVMYGKANSAQARLELSIDLQSFMSTLDPHHLHICQLIKREPNMTAVARALGMSRSTLYLRLAVLRGRLRDQKNCP